MEKVFVAPVQLMGLEGAHLEVIRDAGFDLVFPPKPDQLSEAELIGILDGVTATVAGSEPYTQKVFEARPQLRVVARAGVGYDAVDVAAASKAGCAVTITPNTNQGSVAEHTFGLMLSLSRELVVQNHAVKTGGWPRKAVLPLRGRTLGLAGLGRIGKAVALRARAFEMNLIAYDPVADEGFARELGIRLVSFHDLLAEADYVSLHVPLLPETRHLICSETLAMMKPTAFLINTSRGGLVNEEDLYSALKERRIAGAALDVFDVEPPGVTPLVTLDNVVVTPHAAGVDEQSRDDMALSAAEAIASIRRGNWPEEKVVNAEVRSSFSW